MELEIAEPHRVQVGLFCVGADHALEYKCLQLSRLGSDLFPNHIVLSQNEPVYQVTFGWLHWH